MKTTDGKVVEEAQMLFRARKVLLAVVAVVGPLPAAARADLPVVSGSEVIATQPGSTWPGPKVLIGPDGAAAVFWRGGGSDWWESTRPAAGGAWSQPVALGEFPNSFVDPQIARNDRGDVALGWHDHDRLFVAVGTIGTPLGQPEEVPLPPIPPDPDPPPTCSAPPEDPCNATSQPWTRTVEGPRIAIGEDGTLGVGFGVTDDRQESSYYQTPYHRERHVAYVAFRSSGGGFSAPVQVTDGATSIPSLAADAGGGLLAIWSKTPAGSTPAADSIVEAADSNGTGGFGSPQVLAVPSMRSRFPTVIVNRRGDALAMWQLSEPQQAFPVPAIRAAVATRTPAGAWSAPARLDGLGGGLGFGTFGTGVNDAGDMAVGWVGGEVNLTFRPADGTFGPAESAPTEAGVPQGGPVVLDAAGNTIITRVANRTDQGSEQRIELRMRRRAAPLGDPVTVFSSNENISIPAMAMDQFGNGVAAWAVAAPDRTVQIMAANYSTGPPKLSDVRASAASIRFRLNEPARLHLTVRAGGARAAMRMRSGDGRQAVTVNRAIRRLVRRRQDRVTALLAARDAGPGVSYQRVRLKRRPPPG